MTAERGGRAGGRTHGTVGVMPACGSRALPGLALVALWLVAFIVMNSESVRVSFVFGHLTLSLIWVMIICAVLGGALAQGAPRLRRRRRLS